MGAAIILCGVVFLGLQIAVSIIERKRHRDTTGDPWNGRTLEWSIPSPPPIYNFAFIPIVTQRDPFWAIKRGTAPKAEQKEYEDIHLPRNTPIAFYMGILSLIFGFALTWHIFWLALLSILGIVACTITRLSGRDKFDIISAAEVKKIEERHKYA